LQVSILNNAEPIKLGIYVSPVIAAVLWISGLYKDASSQRNDALRRESLFLSERADQEEASGDNATAALVALEGLPNPDVTFARGARRPFVSETEQSLRGALLDRKELHLYAGHQGGVWSAHVHPSGDLFVTSSEDNTARIWSLSNPSFRRELSGHQGRVWKAVFSGNGKYIATASEDRTGRLWDAQTTHQIALLEGHTGWVTSIAIGSD